MLYLKIIVGSTRARRVADRVVPWISLRAQADRRFDVELLDLREWSLPMFAESYESLGDLRHPTYSDPLVKRWNDAIGHADAYLFVTPEYNHSVPPGLKNAIDSVFGSFAFRNKVAATVAYSGGMVGGARAAEHLAHIAVEVEMVPLRNTILIPHVQSAFDETGEPKDSRANALADIVLDDLAWWGRVLRVARESGALPPAQVRLMAITRATAS